MVHRAVLGSVERMIAILCEHYAGKWPFFLSPRQAMIVPVSKAYEPYACQVQTKLHAAGHFVDVDLSHRTLPRMVRDAQMAQYNYILVVGKEEEEGGSVSVRPRGADPSGHSKKTIDEMLAEMQRMNDEHVLDVNLNLE